MVSGSVAETTLSFQLLPNFLNARAGLNIQGPITAEVTVVRSNTMHHLCTMDPLGVVCGVGKRERVETIQNLFASFCLGSLAFCPLFLFLLPLSSTSSFFFFANILYWSTWCPETAIINIPHTYIHSHTLHAQTSMHIYIHTYIHTYI